MISSYRNRFSISFTAVLLAFAFGAIVHSQEPIVRIVSVPDFINMDMQYRDPRIFDLSQDRQMQLVAEINAGRGQATINPHVGNFVGTLENGYRGASQVLLEAIGEENAACLVVAGDLLYTRWPKVSQLSQPFAEQHIYDQADIYYDAWKDNVREYSGYDFDFGQVFTVVGDHEVGDNPWPVAKRALLPVYRDVYVQKLGNPESAVDGAYVDAPEGLEGRVYAVQKSNLLLVGIDQFSNINTSGGPIDVFDNQLAWLGLTLSTARNDNSIDHIVVMGHAPIAKQLAVNIGPSSGLLNATNQNGDLWQIMSEFGVDLYLAGEVHAISSQVAGNVLQVVTGTNIFQPGSIQNSVPFDLNGGVLGEQNYLVIDSYPDRIELKLKQIPTRIWGFQGVINDPLNDEPYKNRESRVKVAQSIEGFQCVGCLTIDKSTLVPSYVNLTGVFEETFLCSPLDSVPEGIVAADLGGPADETQDGFNPMNIGGSEGGIFDVSFSSDGGVGSRDRGALAAGHPQNELLRDFVFASRNEGASYLEFRLIDLPAGNYTLTGYFHDASFLAEPDPIAMQLLINSTFEQVATAQVSTGVAPPTVGMTSFEFGSDGIDDVVVRVVNLDEDGAHLFSGFTVAPIPALAKGDFNRDGFVNLLDIAGFVGALLDSNEFLSDNPFLRLQNLIFIGDFNEDDQFDLLDIAGFVAALSN